MAEYMISTDTSCDFPYEYVQQHQLPLVTLFYSIDDVMGPDGFAYTENLKSLYNKCVRARRLKPSRQVLKIQGRKLFRTILSKRQTLHIAFPLD